ncbi:helix-turn-helix domain-containing protein [Mongoliimonas terrestris]|uniref:helix-turn-helix domain-containing protein n=1 Tax=Mongoliimonas terrestris TaxID=1709001 RepID=UPI00158810C0|nr:helix-turn-helix domain-containing protein [Mongoliimonas terrestris]
MHDITGKVEGLLAEAYERGRAVGRAEAEAELKERLASLFGGNMVPAAPTVAQAIASSEHNTTADGRLAPGTVKPRVHAVIMEHPEGMRIEDIALLTGFKTNSVRGTLYALKEEGYAEKRGLYWFPVSELDPVSAETPDHDLSEFL